LSAGGQKKGKGNERDTEFKMLHVDWNSSGLVVNVNQSSKICKI
jgi:hypothetical protein